jgi:tripartite-type tricarboxylate transporter receptor subunit TctC
VSWHALFAPATTSKPIIDRLHQDMKKIMTAPDMQKKIADLGLIPMDPPSLSDTQAYLASERTKWGALVRKLGLEGTQ